MELIDGNRIAGKIIKDLKKEVSQLSGPPPAITFIKVGEDPASIAYVNRKQKIARELGMLSQIIDFPQNVTQKSLYQKIHELNQDNSIHGILIQSPLPPHLDEKEVFNQVSPLKDVDGFNAANLGKLCQEDDTGFIACTPAGIIELLKASNVTTEGKHIVILGRSLIVGKPAALLLLKKSPLGNATVTICHSKTKNLSSILKQADIIIVAIGQPHFLKVDMIRKDIVVIDVGINRIKDPSTNLGYRLVGDVDFDNVSKIVSKITPVPGGVGPMTVAMLMKNTLKAYHQQKKINK
ncbi:MAG: bifunctional 5,10-methylene-tetrahydrofolate dehydrogenase/5,10-methylene-tetrahydrofolate cyclohydrolase [Verrucomicrobia bacterium]|nr:MAG: bifunctional 5,10-methylene-tetrahydrofolate dehydrogenase/5,10-methylene-tetrahydrofolate cyclohydrolase [Verrucomicrobiota bacterium]